MLNMKTNKSLNQTNVRLTGNVKLVMDSENNLFFESINSSEYLSSIIFKGYKYNKGLLYTTNFRNFVNQNIGINHLYDVVDTNLLRHTNSLYKQYHNIYKAGCYSEESQLIDENFRYFAPIMIEDTNDTPDYFVILKSNKTGIKDIIKDGEVVQVFDLSEIKSRIFSQIEDSYIISDLENLNVSGYDITTGNHNLITENSFKQLLNNDQTITETNNWVTNAFKRNLMVYTNILNLEFAFTDKNVDGKFVYYSGFYCKKNDFVNIPNSLKLIQRKSDFIKWIENYKYQNYYGRTFSGIGSSFGTKKQSVLEIEMLVNPTASTLLHISLNDVIDYTLIIEQSMISKKVEQTRLNIARKINDFYTGQRTTIRAEVIGNNIRLITNNILETTEVLKFFSTSPSLNIVNPRFGTKSNEFISPNEYSIVTNTFMNPTTFKHIMYEVDGEKIYNEIEQVNEYLGQYLYKLKNVVPKLRSGETFWFVETKIEAPYTFSLLPMYELDMDTEFNNHKTISDFDLVKYREFLETTLNATNFRGQASTYFGVPEDLLSEEQLNEYKSLINGEIVKYFDGIEDTKKVFINDINPITLESTMIEDPYIRLDENNNPTLRKLNRLYPFISKWSSGLDSTNNPNMFNISLPYKHESLNASHIENYREPYKNTHDWFVLVDGLPHYDLNEIQKMSYSRYALDDSSFEDSEFDAYEFLEHIEPTKVNKCYTEIEYDEKQKVSFAYFKGVKYRIERNLKDYKFSVVVKTSTELLDDVFKLKTIQNDTFKTFTIYINFYIPEPILTTLERGNRYYFIDKSLMYFSSAVYSTNVESVDYGTDRISLDLYNNSEVKTYLGLSTNSTNWFHTTNNNETILYVKRGNAGIFNTNFGDILQLGGNLTVSYTSSEDINSPWYGMEIDFEEIVEIGVNHFWCKRIIIKSNINVDVNDDDGFGFENIDENVVTQIRVQNVYNEYSNNNNIFNEDNQLYISKAIAYELCSYNKIITKKANNARYSELCLSNIKMYFKGNRITSNKGDLRVYIDDMDSSDINVLNMSNNNQIERLDKVYSYRIYRQHLKYKPNTKVIQEYYDFGDIKKIVPCETINPNEYVKIVSKVDNEYLDILMSKKRKQQLNLTKFYDYIKASTNGITTIELPWMVAPNEVRTPLVSYVMNTSEKIVVTTENSDILLSDLLMDYIMLIVNLKSIQKSDLVNYLNIWNNTTLDTLDNYNVYNLIVQDFISNFFSKIYKVESIVDEDGKMVQFATLNDRIIIDSQYNGKLKITFSR